MKFDYNINQATIFFTFRQNMDFRIKCFLLDTDFIDRFGGKTYLAREFSSDKLQYPSTRIPCIQNWDTFFFVIFF